MLITSPLRFRTLHGEHVGAHDVVHADEVAHLLAVLEDQGSCVVHQARGEDGGDTGVGVRERLAGAVDVEEAQRRDGQAVGAAVDQAELFLIALGKRVDGIDLGGLGLVGRQRA